MDESADSAVSLDSILSSFSSSPPSTSTASLSLEDYHEDVPQTRRPSASTKKRVRFSTTEIREYRLIPDASRLWEQPYQLTLAWDPIATSTMTVQAFRRKQRNRRFKSSNARLQVLTPYQRRDKLVQSAKDHAKDAQQRAATALQQRNVPNRKPSIYARIRKRASSKLTTKRFDTAAQMPLGWDTNDCVHSVDLSY